MNLRAASRYRAARAGSSGSIHEAICTSPSAIDPPSAT
jgi:hypothetical protein